jgi:hypothetical protein
MITWTAKEVKAGWRFYAVLLLYGSVKIHTDVLIPRNQMSPETAWDCIAKMQAAINRRRAEHEAPNGPN